MNNRPADDGFTLVELLVVIAIIALLLSILVPSMHRARDLIRIVICQANLKGLTTGYIAYTQDNDSGLPSANNNYAGRTSPHCWANAGNTPESIETGALWPYVGNLNMYRCQANADAFRNSQYFSTPVIRSFSVNAYLDGETHPGVNDIVTKFALIPDPASIFVFLEEEDPRGWNMNSLMARNKDAWYDKVATWHDGGMTISFADGRAEYWKWQDPRTLIMEDNFQPGNVDIERLWQVANPRQ